MKDTQDIKKIYTGIQHQLNNLIPEKWESIYLYAAVMYQLNNLETWEMYFYYIPKGILKKNPINVYEVPNRFNVDEEEYLELVDNLCNTIKTLHKEYKNVYNKEWTNMVIAIKDSQFLIEYNDDNLIKSKYRSKDRHIIFKHKYLNIALQSFSKKERKIIQEYLDDEEYNMVYDRYFEYIPKEEVRNYIKYEKDDEFEENIYSTQLMEAQDSKVGIFRLIWNWLKQKRINKKKVGEPIREPMLDPKIQILSDIF